MDKQFLESYAGQTTAELIGLKDNYRIDSLVLAFEQAIQNKREDNLSEAERFVLAIEAMEREVNNGGWDQFFFNTDNQFDQILELALNSIGCPNTAAIARDAIATYRKGAELDDCDTRYYSNTEPIADRLFEFIAIHKNEIELP